ncbi:MAG: hypothetical protein K0R14_496 [Burkholderiales bacterium]|nr:hypothetical protein [Burkholderiales bacterium]
MKYRKISSYLFGLFFVSLMCVDTAKAESYQWLKCNPIPDKIEVSLLNSHNNTIINEPSPRELEALRQDNATITIPSSDYATMLPPSLRRKSYLQVISTSSTVITKPSIYISCTLSEVLLKDCYSIQLRESGYEGRSQEWNIRTNISNILPFDNYNLSGSKEDIIAGHISYHRSDTATVHTPWQLKRSVNYPDYWLFQGKVNISNPSTAEKILGDIGKFIFYPVNQHYYACTLENGDDKYYDTIRKLSEMNSKYIK